MDRRRQSMTGTPGQLSETPDSLDALIAALKSLTVSPARWAISQERPDGCAVRRAARRATVGSRVLHGRFLVALGGRVADARPSRRGGDAAGRVCGALSHPGGRR